MFKPKQDFILVQPIERTASSIIEVVLHEKPNLGTVIAVGPGKIDKRGRLHPLDVKPGDTVRFGDGSTTLHRMFTEYHEAGTRYLIMQEADVAGVVEMEAQNAA